MDQLNDEITMQAQQPIMRIRDLRKDYTLGDNVVSALQGINLDISSGELVAIMGPSGSGKSTLMNILGCLDRPSSGEYWLDGIPVSEMSRNELADVRNRKIGFVFQSFNLLPAMSAMENIELPLLYTDTPADVRMDRVLTALELVGLYTRAYHRPVQLSGGQQQRVAIARALVTGPALLLADEPTGNLDSHTSVEIMAILQQLNADGITIVLVTHEHDIAAYCKRVVTCRDGRIVSDQDNTPISARQQLANQREAQPAVEAQS